MMSRDNEHTNDAGRRGQAVIAEKRVSLTVEFRVSFREITPATVVEMYPSRDPEEMVERQGRLLRALLEDEEALREFIACAVIDEIVAGRGALLRKGLKVGGEEEVLRPLIEALGGEVAEYYAGVEGEEMFTENIDLLLFSTPVKCLAVGMRVIEMSEEGSGSDKHLIIGLCGASSLVRVYTPKRRSPNSPGSPACSGTGTRTARTCRVAKKYPASPRPY